jgi:transposase InsO family protein
MRINQVGNLYPLTHEISIRNSAKMALTKTTPHDAMKWHHRLGHLNKYFLREMQKHDMIKGIHTKFSTLSFCEGCMLGKQHKMSFPKKTTFRASNVLELIHSNICGPLQTCSINGYYYFATFIDHYSRFTAVYFLKQKSDFFSKFKAYKALVENQTNKKIKTLQSDNGGEYKSQAFMNFCEDHGIARQFTNSYTPEQNGIFERKNRTLVESARSMLQTAKLPNSIWADAIATACHIQNRSFISNLDNITPLTMWCGKIPDLSYLIFFGSPRYAHIPDDICKKLDAKSRKGIFVGYGEQEGVKGYILYDKSFQLIISKEIITTH